MKKLLLLSLSILCFTACSVEDDGIDKKQNTTANGNIIQEANLSVEVPGCDAQTYDFGDFGKLEVINDKENLYVNFTASQGYSLSGAKLHIAGDLSGFPTVGRGNLPPGQMDHKENFEPGVGEYTYQFALDDLDENFLVAAQAVFTDGENTFEAWAGDVAGKSGGWSYFAYTVCIPCDPVDAGENNSGEFTQAEVNASNLKSLFLGLLSEGVSEEGIFDPTIAEITEDYNTNPYATFTTTYTLGERECQESVELTLNVVCDPVDAGGDNSGGFTQAEVDASGLEILFSGLLSEGVSEGGTFDPPISDLTTNYNAHSIGTFATTYTVGEGECEDSAELSIVVVEVVECLPVDAGSDTQVTLKNSEIHDQVSDVAELKSKYLSLLSEGVPQDGTFFPTIDELAAAYNENNIGTFSTTYTIGEGECIDSVNLSIVVTADPDDGGGTGGGVHFRFR